MTKKYIGLFIPLPPELGNQLPSLAPKDNSPAHATFLYIGDVQPGREAEFLAVVRQAFGDTGLEPPVRATLDRPEYFNSPNDGRVAVMRVLFNQDMARFRGRLLRALVRAGFPVKDSFPDVYRPHVTLGYLGDGEDYTGPVPSGSWEFDTLEVWGLGDDYVWGEEGQDYTMRIAKTAPKTASETGYRDEETRTYTVTGHGEAFAQLEKVMKAMSILGGWGSSREIQVYFDGDGADKLSVDELDGFTIDNFDRLSEPDVVNLGGVKLTPRTDLVARIASRWLA